MSVQKVSASKAAWVKNKTPLRRGRIRQPTTLRDTSDAKQMEARRPVMQVHVYVYMYICAFSSYTYIYVYTCEYMYMCSYIHAKTYMYRHMVTPPTTRKPLQNTAKTCAKSAFCVGRIRLIFGCRIRIE